MVANQKGGVGKTTTVVNLSVALAGLGYRVAVVDLDPQGALTTSLGFDPYVVKPSVSDMLLKDNVSLTRILHGAKTRLQVAPANSELIATEYKLLKRPDRTMRLRKALIRCHEELDFVIIDTPPSLGLLTVNGIVAATELLIPVKTQYLAMRGVRALLESVRLIRDRINPELRLLGLVATLHAQDSPYGSSVVREIRSVFKHKVFRTIIPLDEAAAVAPAARKAVIDYKPNSSAAAAYRRLAEEVSDERQLAPRR